MTKQNSNLCAISILFFALLFASVTTKAETSGTTVRGGGQAVLCKSEPTRFLDLYEGERSYGIRFDEGIVRSNFYGVSTPHAIPQDLSNSVARVLADAGLSLLPFQESLKLLDKYVLEVRIDFVASSLYGLYGLSFLPGALPEIYDSGVLRIALPSTCRVDQLAVNNWGKNQITISKPLFEQLTNVDASALLIHEVFHSVFVSQRNKTGVRQFVQFVMAPKWFQEKNREAFVGLVQSQSPVTGGYNP